MDDEDKEGTVATLDPDKPDKKVDLTQRLHYRVEKGPNGEIIYQETIPREQIRQIGEANVAVAEHGPKRSAAYQAAKKEASKRAQEIKAKLKAAPEPAPAHDSSTDALSLGAEESEKIRTQLRALKQKKDGEEAA